MLPEHVDWKSYPPEVKSEGFSTSDFRISVDRALLCGHDPTHTQGHGANCVCCFVTIDIRSIAAVFQNDHEGNPSVRYDVDVEPVPLIHNHAHAEIFGVPDISHEKVFRRLRHALRELCDWSEGVAPTRSA